MSKRKTIQNYSTFVKESINMENTNTHTQNINDTRIGQTLFKYKDRRYRLVGYIFSYNFSDGSKKYASVNKEDANCIEGVGVAGTIAPLEDVEFLSKTTTWDEETLIGDEQTEKIHIEEDKRIFDFIKTLPIGLTQKEYRKIAMARTMASFKNKLS